MLFCIGLACYLLMVVFHQTYMYKMTGWAIYRDHTRSKVIRRVASFITFVGVLLMVISVMMVIARYMP
jgi:hypothetical protein